MCGPMGWMFRDVDETLEAVFLEVDHSGIEEVSRRCAVQEFTGESEPRQVFSVDLFADHDCNFQR